MVDATSIAGVPDYRYHASKCLRESSVELAGRILPSVGLECMHVPIPFSCVRLFVTLWTVARQAPLSMGFSKQEYCSGLPCPPPEYLPDPGIKPVSLKSPALAGRLFTTSAI